MFAELHKEAYRFDHILLSTNVKFKFSVVHQIKPICFDKISIHKKFLIVFQFQSCTLQ